MRLLQRTPGLVLGALSARFYCVYTLLSFLLARSLTVDYGTDGWLTGVPPYAGDCAYFTIVYRCLRCYHILYFSWFAQMSFQAQPYRWKAGRSPLLTATRRLREITPILVFESRLCLITSV